MKKLLMTMCALAGFAAFADTTLIGTGSTFESDAVDTDATNLAYFAASAAVDASKVAAYDGDAPSAETAAGAVGNQYLSVRTQGAELSRLINSDGSSYAVSEAIYFDSLVRFDALEEEPSAGFPADSKIAIWLLADEDAGTTNLCVTASKVTSATPTFETTNFVLNASVEPGTWHRVTFKTRTLTIASTEYLAFSVYIDGAIVKTSEAVSAVPAADLGLTGEEQKLLSRGYLFLQCAESVGVTSLAAACFNGTGAADSLAWATGLAGLNEGDSLYTGITITIGANVSGATYSIDGGDPVTISATTVVAAPVGATMTIAYTPADGYVLAGETFTVGSEDVAKGGDASKGAAACNGTWYATFAEAYAAAVASQYMPTLVVNISGDWAPTALPQSINYFQSITFTTESEDPITISLTDGTHTMASANYVFPANATLTLAANYSSSAPGASQGSSATGGTLVIPEGVTVAMTSYRALDNVRVVGAGTIVPTSAACEYLLYEESTSALATNLQAATWTGTLELTSRNVTWNWSPSNFGNADSTIRFNGLVTCMWPGTFDVGTIELVGDGLTINGDYASGAWTFNSDLTGDGDLVVDIQNSSFGTSLKSVNFTCDASDFAGSISFGSSANAYVKFGTSMATGAAQQIIVGTNAEVTVASGETWTASDFIMNGAMTVNGNLVDADDSTVGKVWNNVDTAVLTVNAAGACVLGNYTSFTGTYVVNYNNSANDVAFSIPTNSHATTIINGADGAFGGYPSVNSAAPTVEGKVVLNADWTVGNGWTDKMTTFAVLSGTGNLTVNGTSSSAVKIPYTITTLDNYTGTLGGTRSQFTIGTVNVETAPAAGDKVVSVETNALASASESVPYTVAGVETGTLEYRADGAQGPGLYVAGPAPSVSHTVMITWSEAVITQVTYQVNGARAVEATSGTGITVADNATFTIAALTSNDWTKVSGLVTNLAISTDTNFVLSTAQYNPATDFADKTAVEIAQETGINPESALVTAGPDTVKAAISWAEAKGVSTARVNEMVFTAGSENQAAKAFLFGVADTAEAVAAAEAAFAFTSITPGAVPSIDDSGYNGQVTIKGCATVDGTYVAPATASHHFYKAELALPTASQSGN